MARSFIIVSTPCACLNRTSAFVTGARNVFASKNSKRFPKLGGTSFNLKLRAFSTGETQSNETAENSSTPYAWPKLKSPRVCILGGGFGGLYTALRLESLVWPADKRPQIVLVDQSERFVFKPMLYELLSKDVDVWEIAPYFSDLLANTSIRFVKGSVQSVVPYDVGERTAKDSSGKVCLESGVHIDYDWLVVSLGAESKTDIVPGAKEYAIPFTTLENALEVDRRLAKLERQRFSSFQPAIDVAVVGSGYCGVELSATVSERLGKRGRVQIIDVNTEICPAAPNGNRESALKVLSSRNVKLELGYAVSNISPAESDDKDKQGRLSLELKPVTKRRNAPSVFLEVDIVLWTVGSKATIPPGHSAFPVNSRGQLDTDDSLRVKGHPNVFAIGDSSGAKDSSGKLLPTTAQVALQQADYAGWNIWAAINQRPLLPFRYQHLGEMMTLGRYNGAVTSTFGEDLTLDGVFGHAARRLAYLYRLPTNEHRFKVGVSWLSKSAVDTLSYIQDTVVKLASS